MWGVCAIRTLGSSAERQKPCGLRVCLQSNICFLTLALCADVKRMAAAQTGAVWGHGTATSRLTQIDLVVASEILLQTPEY